MESGVRLETAAELGAELRRLRETAGWRQRDLAASLIDDPGDPVRVETKRTQISNWERGKPEPSGRTVFNILMLLGCLKDPPVTQGGFTEKAAELIQALDEANRHYDEVLLQLRRLRGAEDELPEDKEPRHIFDRRRR